MSGGLLNTHGSIERQYMQHGAVLVCGVDEAGRGPLAGPVVAAAVVFAPGTVIEGVADSKVLSEARRELLAADIRRHALAFFIAEATVDEIDAINILQATLLAMRRAVEGLRVRPGHLLIDGNKTFPSEIPATAVVRGDSQCFSIAAASILAKTHRDAIMRRLDKIFPHYGFAVHKGYATRAHIDAIRAHGRCPQHRRSFNLKSTSSQTGIFDDNAGTGP
jgi:ribonuclease HII